MCQDVCTVEECWNYNSGLCCEQKICALREVDCSNRLTLVADLHLVCTNTRGLGVVSNRDFQVVEVLGQYAGVLTTHNFEADTTQTNSYAIALQLRDVRGCQIFIDAMERGNIFRFANHSCDVTCEFVELRSRTRVVVAVVVRKE